MTFTPSIYVDRYDGRYWMFMATPSGAVVRFYTSYPAKGDAEAAAGILGFKLITKPSAGPRIVGTLMRSNTTPR